MFRVCNVGLLILIHCSLLCTTLPAFSDWSAAFCLGQTSAIASTDEQLASAQQVIKQVAQSIGLSPSGIKVVACDQAEKAFSYVSDGSDKIALGKYIVYNPEWLREVVGSDHLLLVALLGHELGHILNDHFNTGKNLSSKQKEAEADHFAGCAVARLGGKWDGLQDLLSRLRKEKSDLYPDRLASLETARQGFDECGRDKDRIETVGPAIINNATNQSGNFGKIKQNGGTINFNQTNQ